MNLDRLKRFSNQNLEGRFNECVGITIADLLANKYSQPMDSDFSYAAGLAIQNLPPNDAGEDPYAAFLAACAYGALPDKDDLHDPIDTSALLEADFRAYSPHQKELAAYFVQNGVKVLYSFDAVTQHLLTKREGCAIAMRWYSSFNNPYSDGVLRTPAKDEPFTYHCVATYENTDKGLRIKAWQGEDYGRHGYSFLPRSIYSQCYPTGYCFDDEANRFITLVKTALQYPRNMSNMLPLILASATIKRV